MWKWEAEGKPKAVVVIVHNAYEHHSRYAWLIQQLRSSNFHVIMGDLPGHGAAEGGTVHTVKFRTYITYVKGLLNIGIQDELPLFIMGHGLGATLAMHILKTQKIICAGVILSSPWLQLLHQPVRPSNILAKLLSSMEIDHGVNINMLTRNPDLHIEEQEDPYYTSKATAAWHKELQNLMKSVSEQEERICNVPVLVHTASDDQIINTDVAKTWLFNQNLTEFQYKEWKNLYHDVYQEPERDEVFLYTEAFMHTTLRSLGYIV